MLQLFDQHSKFYFNGKLCAQLLYTFTRNKLKILSTHVSYGFYLSNIGPFTYSPFMWRPVKYHTHSEIATIFLSLAFYRTSDAILHQAKRSYLFFVNSKKWGNTALSAPGILPPPIFEHAARFYHSRHSPLFRSCWSLANLVATLSFASHKITPENPIAVNFGSSFASVYVVAA